ncbi:hypothetical protein [Arenimonas sp.]|uniref:hypothetical protein n=1 Tax=Arenimonas sp. TaxID=1872635 RepID=UPI0039E319EA
MKFVANLLPLFLAFGSVMALAQGGKAVETDAQKFVRMTRSLEADPSMDKDKSMRSWLLKWATDSPDVYVDICLGLLWPSAQERDTPHAGALVLQYTFGNAAFQIEHPDQAKDKHAVQIAGVRSALKAYAAILKKDPSAKNPYFDDLLAKDKAGKLDQELHGRIDAACAKKE